MKTFTTPGPAALMVRFAAGRLYVRTAADDHDQTTTLVDVQPANPDSSADVEHAAATTVEQRGETIEVIAPTSKGWFGRNPRLEVRLVVPAHSRVDADVKSADVQLAGELGEVFVATASGDVAVEHAAELQVRTREWRRVVSVRRRRCLGEHGIGRCPARHRRAVGRAGHGLRRRDPAARRR